MKKSPFIQGFKEPTLTENSFYVLSDVRGDGQGKLVIWSQEQSQLIVYRGSNRQIQKTTKVKHVNGILQYYDEDTNSQPAIALTAQNCLYIFRGMVQSFRLKIPDICAEVEEQIAWSQFNQQPNKLTNELLNIKNKLLSEKAKYFLGANDDQQKKEIIQKVLNQGINEKDAICAATVIKQTDTSGVGNVVLGTQLNRLYILDTYGHRIIHERIINSPPCMLFAYGKYQKKYVIICINREGIIEMYTQSDTNDPSQIIRLNTRIISADLSFPDFIILTADNIISSYSFSNQNFKLPVPKFSIKLNKKPIKCLLIKQKGIKLILIAFKDQIRIYNQKELIHCRETDKKIKSVIYGSFARQQNCLILLYEKDGFEVLITHRLFNPKQKYEPKLRNAIEQVLHKKQLVIPKKTSHFKKYWEGHVDNLNNFKVFQRSIKLLKWRTLKNKVTDKQAAKTQLQINSKIQGMGPQFCIFLQIENVSKDPIYNVAVIAQYPMINLQITRDHNGHISMIAPFIPISYKLQVKSMSMKSQKILIHFSWNNYVVTEIVCLPACEDMAS